MFKVNRKVEYALISLKHMRSASLDKLTTAKEICDAHKTPFDPTSRVLQIMTQNGILEAAQGARGGYRIIRDLSKVSFFELAEIITGPVQVSNCLNQKKSHCNLMTCCNIIRPMWNLNAQLTKFLKTFSIYDLLHSDVSSKNASKCSCHTTKTKKSKTKNARR